ncbi:MAG: TIGR04283 family arsenosugar biosynthesis glycosyltransferase [Parvularculaceae bacterium]|nr:TIGR04283 family arsenosugar biosynthesis glycosyltransferase [Parvularculaceae bacterium]
MERIHEKMPQISVVIPTLNAGRGLAGALAALVPAALDGLVCEAVVSDGGSDDETLAIADDAGARIVSGENGRGAQLARGAAAARGGWLLFLHADTVLEPGWAGQASAFMNADADRAAVFSLAFADEGFGARAVAAGAMLRTRLLRSPYGDQGLLISRRHYDAIGGYCDMPLFEDVDIIDRIVRRGGRSAIAVLPAKAVTSPARYRRDGYAARVARNFWCLAQYRLGVAPEKIVAAYK